MKATLPLIGAPAADRYRIPTFSSRCRAWLPTVAALAAMACGGTALAQNNSTNANTYIIRNSSGGVPPVIQDNTSYVPGATEFIISLGSQKAGLGVPGFEGKTLSEVTNLALTRLDNRNRFTAGSGPAVAPYLNFWITDGNGRYAVVANEPSDPDFQALYAKGYNLTWTDLANKVAKVYETSDLSWLPTSGSSGKPAQAGRQNPLSTNLYTFADLANFIIQAPTSAQLATGWTGLGTGAPRELLTNRAFGVNWVFGDTLTNYISGAEGYVVAAPRDTNLTITDTAVLAAAPTAALSGIYGDNAPGYSAGSFAGAATAAGQKAELYFTPTQLFGYDIQLGDIKGISYWTKKGATHAVDPRDWFLALYTKPFTGDVSSATWYGSRLGSEPYFSANLSASAGAWNQWATTAANNQLRFFESTAAAPGANFGTYTDPAFDTFIAANSLGTTKKRKDQDLLYLTLQTGSAWANGFTGQLDGLKVELKNGAAAFVNFEKDVPPAVTPTPAGTDVTNTFNVAGASLTGEIVFSGITASGTTTVSVPLPDSEEYQQPAGFSLGSPAQYVDISTTATYSGKILICLSYNPASFPAGTTPSLYHYEGGEWKDVTVSVDPVGFTICGEVTSLSPFAVGLSSKPSVTAISVTPATLAKGTATSLVLSATIDDTNSGNQNIVSAEYRLGAAGTWTHMTAAAGSFDAAFEIVSAAVPVSATENAGVYTLEVRGTDADGNVSEISSTYFVIYDPNAGSVSGGGWIQSPAGAFKNGPTLAGKANFGFVSKYSKTKTGATQLDGSTQFNFSAGGMNFHSSSYEWLVVNQNDQNAQYKGVGKINDLGSYGFMIWASDGSKSGGVDTFRIQIWDNDANGAIVYDNGVEGSTLTIGGGNIMIHAPAGTKK